MTTADEDRIAARQAEAIKLRVRGKTIRAIAEVLGVSVGQAHADVQAAKEAFGKEAAESVEAERGLELLRLERALEVVEHVLTNAPTLDGGDELQLKALDRLVKIQDQRAKLLGLYTAEKRELSGPQGGPISIDARTALLERIAGRADSAHATGGAGNASLDADGSGGEEPSA